MLAPYRTVRYMRGPMTATAPAPIPEAASETSSARRAAVLAAALALMVRRGSGFSMADVAREASCSKETLYKWFGDRTGLLTATVQWQAAKVVMPVLPDGVLTRDGLEQSLAGFAASWLAVIMGDASLGLNRMAVGEAGEPGQIVLRHGPRAMAGRLAPLFEAGRQAGLITFDSTDEAFRLFFGLVVGDLQIRCLLGDPARPSPPEIQSQAATAAARFLALCAPATVPQGDRR